MSLKGVITWPHKLCEGGRKQRAGFCRLGEAGRLWKSRPNSVRIKLSSLNICLPHGSDRPSYVFDSLLTLALKFQSSLGVDST